MQNVCDMNCFECSFSDCINDELTASDYSSDEVEKFFKDKPTSSQLAKKRWRDKNKNYHSVYYQNYYKDKKDSEIERVLKWRAENRGRINARQKEKYYENIELSRQKQREYRARKKKEMEECKL